VAARGRFRTIQVCPKDPSYAGWHSPGVSQELVLWHQRSGSRLKSRLPSLWARADRKSIQKSLPNPSTGLLGPARPLSPNEAMQKRPQKSSRRIVDLVASSCAKPSFFCASGTDLSALSAMSLIRNRRRFLGALFSALLALALFDPGAATAQQVKQIKLTEKHRAIAVMPRPKLWSASADRDGRPPYSGLHGCLR
jgi:hypothetical protein